MLVEDVRSLWQLGAISEFLTLFGEALRIPELDIETLEHQLAAESEDGPYLREFRLSLLKSLSSNRNISLENMDDFIRRQYTYRRIYPNPLLKVERVWKELSIEEEIQVDDDDSDLGEVEEVEQQTLIAWLELSVPQRVGVLHDLCEWQLQSEKFRERVGVNTELQATQWRVAPVGIDADQQQYYLLSNGRLYSCNDPVNCYAKNNKKRKRGDVEQMSRTTYEDDWTCVANTYEEWQELVKGFAKSRDPDERQLLKFLKESALPYVEAIEAERVAEAARKQAREEKAEAERVKEMMRQELLSSRKRSSRIQMIDERKEAERERAEQLRREQELEEKARALARKEAAGEAPAQPKTREARLRDRELREALAQMHRQNGQSDSVDTPMEDAATPSSEVQAQVLAHDDQTQSTMLDNGYKTGVDELRNGASTDASKVNFMDTTSFEPAADVLGITDQPGPVPPSKVETLSTTKSPAQTNQQENNGQHQSHLPIDSHKQARQTPTMHVSQSDAAWVNSKADEMARGGTVPHEQVFVNGHAGQRSTDRPTITASADPPHFTDRSSQAQDALSRDIQPQNGKSAHRGDDIQVSEADMSWVQKQAEHFSGPQTVPQETVSDTIRRMDDRQ